MAVSLEILVARSLFSHAGIVLGCRVPAFYEAQLLSVSPPRPISLSLPSRFELQIFLRLETIPAQQDDPRRPPVKLLWKSACELLNDLQFSREGGVKGESLGAYAQRLLWGR